MPGIFEWLDKLELAQYAKVLETNGVDLSVLLDLTDQDLEKLGILVGHRRKMLRAIADLAKEPQVSKHVATTTGAERRHMTVMFCDLVGSTALASEVDPEDMSGIIRSFQDACAGAVARYEGFVAKFMGDGVLVYFGYPRAQESDSERAVRAGLEIVNAVRRLRVPAADVLEVRVGIATGRVVVGDVVGGLKAASGAAQERAVVGETPNLAARLQSVAEPGTVVVARSTRRLIGDLFALRELGPQQLKGLPEPVEAWVVEGVSPSEMRFEAVRSSTLTAFVGRETEVGLMSRLRLLAWQGSGQVVLISGEPGIGKSRFVRRFSELVSELSHKRLRYQCSPFHTASVLYPFIEQMKRAAGFEAADPPDIQIRKLEALVAAATSDERGAAATSDERNSVPLFASLLSVPTVGRYPPLGLSAAQQRRQTLAALLDQLEMLARRKPILAVMEDLHWADATSLEVIDLAIERIRHLPVLILLTYRPEFEPSWVGLENVHSITLSRLERRDVCAMIASVAAARPLPPEVVDQIAAKTDGVPLFVEELTKMMLESGLMVAEGAGFRLDGPLPPMAIPDTLQDSLMARIDRLAFVKEVAQVGAAIGREFPYALLKLVAGREAAAIDAALEQLASAELIFRVGSSVDVRYRFKHALVQNAAYESLLKSRRQPLHRRIAEALRDQFQAIAQTEPEVVGHHFAQAGLHKIAADWWRKAAESALGRSAYVEAIAHYTNAVDLAASLADGPEQIQSRLQLQIAYGRTLLAAHSHGAPVTTAAFDRASELATTIEDPAERYQIYYGMWGSRHVRGEMPAARALADAFASDAERDPASPEAGLAHRALGTTCWTEGDFLGARSHLERALALSGEGNPELRNRFGLDPGVAANMQLAMVMWQLGDIAGAGQLAADGLHRANDSRHIPTLAYGHGWTCLYEAIRGAADRVAQHAEILVGLSTEHHLPLWHLFGTFFLDWARWRTGDRHAGLARMRQAVDAFRSDGLALYLTFYPVLLAEAEAEAGNLDRAWTTLAEALATTERTRQRWFLAESCRQQGALLLRRQPPDLAAAEAAFSHALSTARKQQARVAELRVALSLARLHVSTGRIAAARDLLAASLAHFRPDAALAEVNEASELAARLVDPGT